VVRTPLCHKKSDRIRAAARSARDAAGRMGLLMEKHLMLAVGGVLAILILGPAASAASGPALTGMWRSAVEETLLSSQFDESVWGRNAKSTRVVEMTITSAGEATLTVTRKILDARGREIRAATSIEHVEVSIGAVQHTIDVRSDLVVTVKKAERRYPDDPSGTWPLDGLRVTVSTFSDDPSRIEVRIDTPEGPGSFWETLRRVALRAATRPSP
jgi:hypothetical protein